MRTLNTLITKKINLMKTLNLFLIVSLLSTKILSQTFFTPSYSQALPLATFQSLSGWHGGLQLNAQYHNISSSSVNYFANIDYFSPRLKAGFGVNAFQSNGTDGLNSEQFIQGYYARRMNISKLSIAPSLAILVNQSIINLDSTGNYSGTNSDSLLISNNFSYVAVNAGIGAFFKSFYAAAQISKINQPRIKLTSVNSFKLPLDFNATLGWNRSFGIWTFSPSISYYSQNAFSNYALSMNAMRRSINVGFRYSSTDQISIGVGYDLFAFARFSYTYTRNISYLSSYSNNNYHSINVRLWLMRNGRKNQRLIQNLGLL